MKKRIMSMLLILAMAISSTACGDGKKTDDGNKEQKQGQEQVPGQKQEPAAVPGKKIEKYEPGITVTSVRVAPNAATQAYGPGEDAENNVWTQMLREKYGITVKYRWVAPDGQEYTSKLNLDITAGDMADYFPVDRKQLSELAEAGMLQPLDEVWEMYASENTKNLIETEGGKRVMDACMYDGKMMAIPFTGNPKESAPLLYIREDWMKNLNLETPETMHDIIRILEAFASQDPDKNGADDTYAAAIDKFVFSSIMPLFSAENSYPGILTVNENGELTTGYTDENTKKVLQLLNQWYEAGDIDPEWFTKDAAKSYETIVNGKVGIFFGGFPGPLYPLQAQHDMEPESDWIVMPVPGYDGKPIKNPYNLGINSYYVVSDNFEHPEAMIMMLNDWVDLFYYNTDDAVQLKYINSAEGAEIWQNAPVQAYRGFKNVQQCLDITKYYEGNLKKEELTAEERNTVKSIDAYNAGDEKMWAWNKIFGIGGAAGMVQTYIDNDSYIFNEHWGNPTATEVTNGSTLSDYQQQSYAAFINGEKSFDEWDQFVSEYRGMGYDKILEELKEQYQIGK